MKEYSKTEFVLVAHFVDSKQIFNGDLIEVLDTIFFCFLNGIDFGTSFNLFFEIFCFWTYFNFYLGRDFVLDSTRVS